MKLRYGMTVGLLAFGIVVAATANLAVAGPPIAPGPTTNQNELPKFGFNGQYISGQGYRITSITPGGRFAQAGLKVGDIILTVNGFKTTTPNSWTSALKLAGSENATSLHLQLQDGRTKQTIVRDFFGVTLPSGALTPAAKAELVALQRKVASLQSQVKVWEQRGGFQAEQQIKLLEKQIQSAQGDIDNLQKSV